MKETSMKAVSVQQILLFVLSFVLVFSLFCWSLVTGATEVFTAEQQATSLQPLKGTFSQSKNIKPLKRPFKSEGSFVYFPNKGLLWHTKKPVDSLKLFAHDGVYKIDEQGALQKEAQLDNDFFLALFSANEQKLAKFFTTEVLQSEGGVQVICLALTPISDTMRSLFKQVNLCMSEVNVGTKIPNKIELIEEKGNNTEILLQLSSAKVSPRELAYFD